MGVNLEEERSYLNGLTVKLRDEADRLLEKMRDYQQGSLESARYLWEHQSDFDGYEKIFNEILLNQVVTSGEQTKESFRRILKMLDSPYFARIDFKPEDDPEEIKVYIGKFPFRDRKYIYEIFDWRAPISSMYYEFEYGAAYYIAPMGKICGDVLGKRQYKIKRGLLEYALESSINISDEILQQELSRTSDYKMRDIVSTIQKEQNRLIRNESAEVLIIQGVAGSGKTSIALHRVAYFLYRFKNELTAENFLIISPNQLFVDYISDVLPELGEENVKSIDMEDIAQRFLYQELRLKGIQYENLYEQPERFLYFDNEAWRERNAFKCTVDFVHQLKQYLKNCDEQNFIAEDYVYEGGKIEAAFIQKCYSKKLKLPVRLRLQETAGQIAEAIREQSRSRGYGTHKNEISEWLAGRFKNNDAVMLYQTFYQSIGRAELFQINEGNKLEAADIFPLIYVKLYLDGCVGNEKIKHVIIDEMQDYTPIQYAVLNILYPCRKTILGDFSQNVIPFVQSSMSFLEELYPKAQTIEIHKSYRSTCEIMKFAQRIKRNVSIDPVERHGEEPNVLRCVGEAEERETLLALIEKAYETDGSFKMGIICKDEKQAGKLYDWIARRVGENRNIQLITHNSEEFCDGIMITSVCMSKGLEFDEAVIYETNDINYYSDYDRGLLYVACTRAMHKLTLLYSGEVSRFLGDTERKK